MLKPMYIQKYVLSVSLLPHQVVCPARTNSDNHAKWNITDDGVGTQEPMSGCTSGIVPFFSF